MDITQQKHSQFALQESEERFRNIANDSPMCIFMIAENAEVSFWNKTWLDYTGQSFEEALGRSWERVIHPDDFELTLKDYLVAFNARQPCTMENRIKARTGEYRWFLWKGAPRYLPNGEFAGFYGDRYGYP